MEQHEQTLKQDVVGRVWTPRAQREAALDEYERSGLPGTAFAARIGVKYQTFISWKQKRRKERAAVSVSGGEAERGAAARLGGWIEATMAPAASGLVVHLPGGALLGVRDAGQALLAAQLLRSLSLAGVGPTC